MLMIKGLGAGNDIYMIRYLLCVWLYMLVKASLSIFLKIVIKGYKLLDYEG